VLAVVQLLALHILAPLVGAATIASERERGTFSVLVASPVSRTAIATGKMAAAYLYCLMLLAGSLPVATLAHLLGGPDTGALLGLYLGHAVVAGTLVALGFATSTLFHRTWSASFVAIGLVAGLAVGSAMMMAVMGGPHSLFGAEHIVMAGNSFASLFLFMDGRASWVTPGTWWLHFAAMALLATGAFVFGLRRLRHARQ